MQFFGEKRQVVPSKQFIYRLNFGSLIKKGGPAKN